MEIVEEYMNPISFYKLNENKIKTFKLVRKLRLLYHDKMNSFNFHLLYHTSDFIYWFGPLYLMNLFPFEGNVIFINFFLFL
jgi:hypothetical protein